MQTSAFLNSKYLVKDTCLANQNRQEFEISLFVGFTGKDCETNIDDCASTPCQNHKRCIDGEDAYTCECLAGFYLIYNYLLLLKYFFSFFYRLNSDDDFIRNLFKVL